MTKSKAFVPKQRHGHKIRNAYPEWMDDPGLPCVKAFKEGVRFFPPHGRADGDEMWDMEARRVCRRCPYQMECLAYAIEHNEHGVWGGSYDDERSYLRRKRQLGGKPLPCPRCDSFVTGTYRKAHQEVKICIECGCRFETQSRKVITSALVHPTAGSA